MEYGCIGEKLSHSFSKIIHNALCDYDYELVEIEKDKLDEFMKNKSFKAINVTIPYKEAVIPYLYYIDDVVKKIGAVNTIINKDGKLYGYNTDFSGMTALINKNKISLNNKKVLVLGSGGTSKTAFAVAESMNAREVLRVSRKKNNDTITYDEAYTYHSDAEIIINTTPVGMYPKIGFSPIDIKKFEKLNGVVDAVYNPLCSELIVNAKNSGIKATGGLYMLVAQAVFAAERFTSSDIPYSEIDRVYKDVLSTKENIVLIGMPGSGKTTIGKMLAEKYNKKFIDTDVEIENKTNSKISDIFNSFGEKEFRRIESSVISDIAPMQNVVIATGGGAILNKRNIDLLKQNGKVIFLNRPLDSILPTDDRPLSSDRISLEKRFNERYDLYVNSADFTVEDFSSAENTLKSVCEVI